MRRVACLLLLGFLLPLDAVTAAEPAKLSASALAAKIDEHIAARLKERKVPAAPLADDGELVRRLSLDLIGRIPELLAARDFIDNPGKDKRAKLVEKLLADDRYALHWANVWRAWLVPNSSDQQIMYLVPTFEIWLRDQLKTNASYDSMVRSLITSDASRGGGGTSGIFTQANMYRPENLASSTARLFLGVKLECAQCHNHPTAKWKRQQFWEMAAFYSGPPNPFAVRNPDGTLAEPLPVPGEIPIPGTDKKVKATFLDGKKPKTTDYRTELVDWMVAKDNPLFARAAVNRIWEYLMGTGLVEPVDEESAENLPSHPALFDLLAKQFAASGYDLKYLISAIAQSQAYQRSSKLSHKDQADPRLFARVKVRGLSPEQLYDSLALATGQKEEQPAASPYGRGGVFNPASPRADFIRRFPSQEKRTDQQTSILQALYLMNGKIVADATSLEHNENLKIIAEGTSVKTSKRISQLFLITLSRNPTSAEVDRLVKYVDKGGPTKDSARALCDVFWALLNSSEFSANH